MLKKVVAALTQKLVFWYIDFVRVCAEDHHLSRYKRGTKTWATW